MVKYIYNPDIEMFRRIDNKGPSLKVNIVEARRIESLMNLGIKAPTIMKKIDFVNDVSMTNLRTIMSNIEQGNLELEGDYPSPTELMKDMDMEARIAKLERDFEEFKRLHWNKCSCAKEETGIIDKVKLWIARRH